MIEVNWTQKKREKKKKKKMETVWDRRRRGWNRVETWEKWERRGRNCILPFLNLSERRGRYFHLSKTRVPLALVWWVHDVHHAIHTACGRACKITERWRDERQWVRELKRWEVVSERAEEMRGVRGWNEERNWKFRVLTLYIYEVI